mmetsp:Transcript_1361/g.2385  ORF Transcript_1361/g.2385 Transcript_1361/m.2385 type:complete len:83 (-) Transcript_1361:670-918(-)
MYNANLKLWPTGTCNWTNNWTNCNWTNFSTGFKWSFKCSSSGPKNSLNVVVNININQELQSDIVPPVPFRQKPLYEPRSDSK